MESQRSQAKLTRTRSSPLRSSSSNSSSIHSLSSVSEGEINKPLNCQQHEQQQQEVDDEQDDILLKQERTRKPGSPHRTRSSRLVPIVTMASLSFFTLFSLSLLVYFLNLKTEEIPTSENLLLALIFITITLFLANKNKKLIKQMTQETTKKLSNCSWKQSRPVQWFIGETTKMEKEERRQIVREWVELYSNGDLYEGEFHEGKCNGSGVYHFFVNGRYEGDWVDGKYDGYGIESWARGSMYKGQYRQGLRQGYGVYRFYTGDSYAGQWCNGQCHGVGIQTCADGISYFGQFKCTMKHGLGVYMFRNGDRYAVEYFGDKIRGFGVYQFANGHCYEGSWREGRKQGYGIYTFRSGDRRCGEWDGSTLNIRLPPQADAVIRAVQGARKAAQNAFHAFRVDEQVNKAVEGENMAATAARVAAVKAVQKPDGW